jgi:hypothetical protein
MIAVRRRVSLRKSFKDAWEGAFRGADYPGGEIIAILATIVFGLWWWIVGVPTRRENGEPGRKS